MTTQKLPPMRRCMGCMISFPKGTLVRVLRTPDNEIIIDRTGRANGRGAYLCDNVGCFAKARKAKRIERALKCEVPEEVFVRLDNGDEK